MAYLNLRDRRIEAKVAYVGPAASGKATNLEQLRRSLGAQAQITNAGDALSLSWQPADNKRFRDCEVSVCVEGEGAHAPHGARAREGEASPGWHATGGRDARDEGAALSLRRRSNSASSALYRRGIDALSISDGHPLRVAYMRRISLLVEAMEPDERERRP